MKSSEFAMFRILVAGVLMSAAGFAAGCGDDEPEGTADAGNDTAEDTGSGADTVETDTVETDTVETDTAEDTQPDTVEPVADQCINDADLAILMAEGGVDAVTDSAQDCGLSCLPEDDPGACSQTCLAEDTGLTAGCSSCYAGVVVCSIENCLAACAADPDSEECGTCQQENCLPDFYTCRGELPVVDACLNDADLALLNSDAELDAVTDSAQDCGLSCLPEDDPGACAETCLAEDTGLSADCSGCYAGVVVCSIENCLASCAADPDSEECGTCQEENCLPGYYACRGELPEVEDCADGVDNLDGDGLVDCADDECTGAAGCEGSGDGSGDGT